jgi:hypothetical protein
VTATDEPTTLPAAALTVACEEWPITWPCPITGIDQALTDGAHSLAAQLLWAMSGYRVGRCTFREAFRPAAAGGCGFPYKDQNGNWRNGGRIGGQCCKVLLSHRPVESIFAVAYPFAPDGGDILDPDTYVLEGSWLRSRVGCWPMAGECEDPELLVTYYAGVPFPIGTGGAVGEVACEYLTALQGGQCRLPSRATSITRQGVTVTLDTAAEFVGRGRIGLPMADAWLESVVGIGPRVASRVYSPDLPRAVRA